eukprot:CCRYP_004583-RD/>CCRYP_004583-RD protein AED:0.04 eAED:0.04 QI:1013/1/1/1/0.87/0.66/9/209/1984
MPPPTSSTPTASVSAASAKVKSIVSSASFGSTSSISTLTSAGKGRTSREQIGDAVVTKDDNLFAEEMAIVDNPTGEESDYLTGWDQDEIDLWRSDGSHFGNASLSRLEEKSELPTEEERNEMENWVSQRRRLMELRQKRWNWDELGPEVSLVGTGSKRMDGHFDAVPVADARYDVIPLETQRIGLSAASELSPAMHSIPRQILPREGSTKDNAVAASEKSEKRKGGGAVIVDDGKQHWMPDSLCKQCYSCEAPFTMLRRKHHCRLCGMIFCAGCSAYFVQISPTPSGDTASSESKGAYGTMRTCKMCHDHLAERGLGVMMRVADLQKKMKKTDNGQSGAKTKSPRVPVDDVESEKERGTTVLHQSNKTQMSARDILLPLAASTPTPPDDDAQQTSSEALTEQFASLQNTGDALGGFQALSLTKQRLNEERRKREEVERVEAAAGQEEEAAAAAGEEESGSRLKSRLSSVRPLRWKSSSDLENEGKDRLATVNSNSNSVEGGVDPVEQGVSDPVAEFARATVSSESCGVDDAVSHQGQSKDAVQSAKNHLGMVAADYLEKLCRELLQTDAPTLLEEIKSGTVGSPLDESSLTDKWVDTLMTISTRCCSTVEPDVKNGDYLDIRPYCKVKVISGGLLEDYAYISGVAFHNNVTDKKMSKVINNAKIMLLSGGIEFTRTENRVSLDALLEQEERYMEILVTKIFKLKPNVLLVGRSVSRKAQELLLRANIALIQYVKPTLMTRIARQTGATVLSSIDHVTNGTTILGHCRRFRLVTVRDNDVWTDNYEAPVAPSSEEGQSNRADSDANVSSDQAVNVSEKKCVSSLLLRSLPNHERQAVLAAKRLGENVLDGNDAVRSGLAKRGVVKTYVMIEGCPKEVGCTVILRGASRPALKQVKKVLRFMINAAYNMKLETSYIIERSGRLPPSYKIPATPCSSSSLCVDFGQPPNNRKVRPWNGSQKDDGRSSSISGKITPLDHQAILITSVWMTDKTQCCPAEVKGICYYSMQDVSLGQFLRDSCFNLALKCQNPSCKKSVIDHSLSFIHNDGMINITVERMDNPIPTSSLRKQRDDNDTTSSTKQEKSADEKDVDGPIATWTFCTKCEIVVTPLQFISKQTWQWSFGKFLEVYFYNRDAIMNAPGHRCSCQMQTKSVLYFGCGNLAARFTYERISPYSVFCRRHLPFDESCHRTHSLQDLDRISVTSSSLFAKFDRQIEVISRETRELFDSAINKPEHLQAVLSELNLVSAEVDNASKVLQERISTVTAKYSKAESTKFNDEALFNFPWYSRRYIFMLSAAWNERLSAAGQAVSAMKKVQYAGLSGRGDSAVVPAMVVGDASNDDVIDGMRRIRQLQESYARNYNVRNMTMSRNPKDEIGLFEGNILPDGGVASMENEDDDEFISDQEIDFDEDDIDADVLASRNRVYSPQAASSSKRSSRPRKTLGTRRDEMDEVDPHQSLPIAADQISLPLGHYDSISPVESQGKSKAVTAGGAMKSAITRFFNRGGNKEDPYIVDLGMFGKGRPRLQPGINGMVIPVFDDQPSTIIAHSLASSDYDNQFKQFLNATTQPDSRSSKNDSSRKDIERRMLGRNKSHIKHTFRDFDEKGQQLCKFVCTTFWSVQFNAVRQAFMNPNISVSGKDSSTHDSTASSLSGSKVDIERSYIRSLATSFAWAASGGKSGAAFSRTTDDRFVIKCISRTELQMFLDCAPAYFEYLSKAFFHGLPTVLCKIVGVYQIGYHNRVTGKRTMEQVAVMQNIFFGRNIARIFDLKGSLRGRFTRQGILDKEKETSKSKHGRRVKPKSPQRIRSESSGSSDDSESHSSDDESESSVVDSTSCGSDEESVRNQPNSAQKVSGDNEKPEKEVSIPTLLDGDFLEFTSGKPLPLTDRAKAVFHMSILNDTLFLSIINVLDYSILVGIDEEKMELVVGIIDYMRQYDILKQMERVGKSLPMVVGSEAPTIIQPPLYKARFTNAMERYFMTVPSKWTSI